MKKFIPILLVFTLVGCFFLISPVSTFADSISTISIVASEDDSEEMDDGSCNPTNTSIAIGTYISYVWDYDGFRFLSVDIPQGSTIQSATMNVYVFSFPGVDLDIHCEDNSTPAEFTADDNNISDRALTTNYTLWSNSNVGTNDWETTPDFSSAVQEVISRGDWQEGNNLAIIFTRNGRLLQMEAYDNAGNNEAELDITYTPPELEAPKGQSQIWILE